MHNSYIGVGAGPAGQVLAGPLLFKVKIKFHFCKKQVMNRSASVILGLLGQLYYSTTGRKSIPREATLSAAHARTQFIAMLTKYILCTIASSKVLV